MLATARFIAANTQEGSVGFRGFDGHYVAQT